MKEHEFKTPKVQTKTSETKDYFFIADITNVGKKKVHYETTPEMHKAIRTMDDNFRKKQVRKGRCGTTKETRFKCQGDCEFCEYRIIKDIPMSLLEENERSSLSNASHVDNSLYNVELKVCIDAFLERLDDDSRKIMLYVFNEITDREAAMELGMSRSTYNDKKKRIIAAHIGELEAILKN